MWLIKLEGMNCSYVIVTKYGNGYPKYGLNEFKEIRILEIVQRIKDKGFQGLSYGCLVGKQLDKDKDWNLISTPI